LLVPGTPMLFRGQEFGATQPFLFFVDHGNAVLASNIYEGRKKSLSQFPSYGSPAAQAQVPDSCAERTFLRSKLDFSERERHAALYQLHQDLLWLRREDPVIAAQDRLSIDGAVLGSHAFVIRFFNSEHGDRLLVVNLGRDIDCAPTPEPLLAPSSNGA
ncbi:MAG TPA: DUF3459 domain-containing protein, partial [Nitrososphaera sp.]|nr:DUF3459 domain-containing protein [Nitrososphaera sp.]